MSENQGVLVRSDRDPLQGRSLEQFKAILKERLAGRVDQAWIFGSVGTSDFGPESDVDIILIVNSEKPFLDRSRDFFDVMDLALAMDLLVYTPQEFARLTTNPSPGFWASVVSSMRRIV